ncbi:single-stranded DNA-binding protein [Wolbachia endosymbiont of Chironomus riparius]|uniref:single-stranded DNA-binding protein n=1 Tax=Wolbachia endosymbiont of Chironomus riparius TaxID=2883238 RepID=UPI00209FA5E7|nr:single-stranded DNA-binding protein [Wolbachia endosymbiont of Chironomus riparius]
MSGGSINKVILIGNLGRDPDIRTTQNGREMATFSIATSESWTDKPSGMRSEKTDWHNIVIFSEGLVRIAKDFIRKGSKVYIEGSLRTRKWTDQNGNERYTTEVVLYNFNSALILLDSRNSTSSSDSRSIQQKENGMKEDGKHVDNQTRNKTLSSEYGPVQYKSGEEGQNYKYEDDEVRNELIDDEIPF